MNLRRLCDWKDEVVIVPYSGVQILDFGFNLNDLTLRPMRFVERVTGDVGGREERTLIPFTGDEEIDARIEAGAHPADDEYSIRSVAALEPFLNQWIPVPVLRKRNAPGPLGEELFDRGPSTWSRLRITELPEIDAATGHTHRVQLAIDTNLVAQHNPAAFLAPSREDSEGRRAFRFCAAPKDMDWFIRRPEETEDGETIDRQRWVSDWLEELFKDFKRAQRPGRPLKETDFPHLFEHWARYLALLALVDHAVRMPLLRLADTVHARDAMRPVEVDLVLDIGNSRTCGILIESFADSTEVDLTKSYPLQLRDLGEPERHYEGLLESRVEFASAQFGSERHARASGRANAFIWPSLVRVGPEAMRLIGNEEGTETASGLSSPKRYLWDDTPYPQDWRFQGEADTSAFPKVARAAMVHLNEAGDVIAQVKDDTRRKLRRAAPGDDAFATRPRFSRSSMFGFMLQELLAHALVQINDPAARADRAQSDVPRRLRRVILTLPTATPIQEQAIIRSRAEGALKLLMAMQGFAEDASRTTAVPELIVEWDEASCTQLVYLYSEITQRFDGQIDAYLKLRGKPRPRKAGEATAPSLRIACIDVGGGTTDLMVMSYHSEANRLLHPDQLFREGFRIAGDDLVQSVVAGIVLPRLRDSIEAEGGFGALERLKELFGANVAGPNQRTKELRRQFTLRALTPLAIAILTQAETAGELDEIDIEVSDILGTREIPRTPGEDPDAPVRTRLDLPERLLAYLEEPIHANGAPGWSFADVTLRVQRADVDAIVRDVLGQAIGNMCEVIGHLGCDLVLLTGRPSRLPAVRSLVEEQMIVAPDRLVSMHTYRAGAWYPYRDPVSDRIADPKSTVAVGGMLIALATSRIPNFRVDTSALRMRSTARFIGEMETNGRIPADKVIFSEVDLDGRGGGLEKDVNLYNPMFLGSRQLPLERWTTTPLYQLDFATEQARARPVPLTIRLEREEVFDEEAETAADVLRREAAQEAFRVTEVVDAEGVTMKNTEVRLKLNTLGQQSEYWLDTGVIRGI
ncbi:MAG: virulence factor SrfB [Rubricella sp.]